MRYRVEIERTSVAMVAVDADSEQEAREEVESNLGAYIAESEALQTTEELEAQVCAVQVYC